MASEGAVELFLYDESKNTYDTKFHQIHLLRQSLDQILLSDSLEAEQSRDRIRQQQLQYHESRFRARRELEKDLGQGWDHLVEPELEKLGLPALPLDTVMRPEVISCEIHAVLALLLFMVVIVCD